MTAELETQADNCLSMQPTGSRLAAYFVGGLVIKKFISVAVIYDSSARMIPQSFFDALLASKITMAISIDLASGGTVEQHAGRLKASGAAVIVTLLTGPKTTAFYNAAAAAQLTDVNGYQWVGDSDAQKGFAWDTIKDVVTHYGSIAFLVLNPYSTSMYVQNMFTAARPMFAERLGGNDPLWSDVRGVDRYDNKYEHLTKEQHETVITMSTSADEFWFETDYLLILMNPKDLLPDSPAFVQWRLSEFFTDCPGLTFAGPFCASFGLGAGEYMQGNTMDATGARITVAMQWQQLTKNNMIEERAQLASTTNWATTYSPWQSSYRVLKTAEHGFIEAMNADSRTLLDRPAIHWNPKATLTTIESTWYV